VQFVITCPVDGAVEVGIEDIDTVVLREPEHAEVVFACPECGTEISVEVRIPTFLVAAIEEMAADDEQYAAPLASLMAIAAGNEIVIEGSPQVEMVETAAAGDADPRIEAYCEYFRRQLAGVEHVEDALRELGCSEPRER
jgi:hypothetical protein